MGWEGWKALAVEVYSTYTCDGGAGKGAWCQVDREGWEQSSGRMLMFLPLMAMRVNAREHVLFI